MYCPSCGTESNDQTKYCTRCGVNLRRVKGVLGKGGASFMEAGDLERAAPAERKAERKLQKRKTPEEKRFEEIKAGVITSSVGFGLMVFFSLLFEAIATTVEGPEANILRSLWVIGFLPFMIGLGVIFNGLFVSKRIVELKRQQEQRELQEPLLSAPNTSPVARLVEPSQSPISDFSITETTTTKLREPVSALPPRDTN